MLKLILVLLLGAAAGVALFSIGVVPDDWIPPALSERNDAGQAEATPTPTPAPSAPATTPPAPTPTVGAAPAPSVGATPSTAPAVVPTPHGAATLTPTPSPARLSRPNAAPSATPAAVPPTPTPTQPAPTPTPTPSPAPSPDAPPTTLMYPAAPNQYYVGGHTQTVAIESGAYYDVYLTWRCDDQTSCMSSFRFDGAPIIEYFTRFGPGAAFVDKRTCLLTTRNRGGEHTVSVDEGHWRVRFERRQEPC